MWSLSGVRFLTCTQFRSLRLSMQISASSAAADCVSTTTVFLPLPSLRPNTRVREHPSHFLLLAFLPLYPRNWSHQNKQATNKNRIDRRLNPHLTVWKYVIIFSQLEENHLHPALKRKEKLCSPTQLSAWVLLNLNTINNPCPSP